jgi:superfamily II DNA or RNA helicase
MDVKCALEAIAAGEWEGPLRFAARQQFVNALSRWHQASGGMPTLLGSRIHPVPHQLYAARRVLADEWPRHLLADEVGLGKTIEAGLVIQAMRGFHSQLRILVAAPGAMGRQWLCEMFVRFSEQVFALLDAGRLALDEAGPLLDHGHVIVSFTSLEVWPHLQEEILEREWDLVILDEAHQVQPGSQLYQFLHKLSAASKGFLALSATPSRRDLDGLCGLLALVDPANVDPDNTTALKEKLTRGEGLEKIVCNGRTAVALQGTKLCRRRLKELNYQVSDAEKNAIGHLEAPPQPGDDVQTALTALYRQKASGSPLVALALLESRRKILNGETEVEEEPIGNPEISLSADPGPEEEDHLWKQIVACARPLPGEEKWLQTAIHKVRSWMETTVGGSARFRAVSGWIQSLLDRERNAKVLVFSGDCNLVEDFENHISEKIGDHRVAHIHHRMAEVTLADEALRFQKQQSCAVLVSDELGGEGRNFQFASAVVHLDLPWSPARLEQRIGRLDRMGRDPSRPVLSVVPRGSGRTEKALLGLHSRSLNVFETSLGGLEFMLAPLQARIFAAFMAGPEILESLSREVAVKVAEERKRAESAQGLSTPDPERLDEATRQAKSLGSADPDQDEQAIRGWLQLLGGRCESVSKGGTMLGWDKSKLRRPLDAIPGARIRRTGTFKRHQALRDESLEFFAPGHPVVDELIRDLLTSPDGRACALSRDLGPLQAGNRFLVVAVWVGPVPTQTEPPHELVGRGKPRWSRRRQRVVQLGRRAELIEENELISRIIAPCSESDQDLTPDDIEIPEAELNAAFKLATKGAKDFHFDSVAIVVGSSGYAAR